MDKDITEVYTREGIISIIIATKNGGKFLPRSISSIEKQTEKNIEIIVVSDRSTDDTISVAQKLAEIRPFIKIINLEKNIGPGLARNVGIKAAKGNYIALLDDDDEWLDEDKLKNQRKFLDGNPEHILIGASETEFVSENGNLLELYKPEKDDAAIRNKILISNQFITSSTMFRKNIFEKVGGFADMRLAEDYDLWLRMIQEGKTANIPACKTRYHVRSTGAQQSNVHKMNLAVLGLVKRYKKNFPHSWVALIAAYLRIILAK